MPELPEVETIVRGLRRGLEGAPPLPGQTIRAVTLRWPRHVETPSAEIFTNQIRGRKIEAVRRRAKYVHLPLDRGALLIHLRMSGDLRMARSDGESERFEHSILHLDSGWDLRFSDARKFGRLYLVDDPEFILGKLGPEPLEPAFSVESLAQGLAGKRRAIKPLLLDQRFLAGLGNIYTDEALHRAGLHPLRRSDQIKPGEVERLWQAIREALQQGIEENGASLDWVYRGGNFQNHFRVYDREGEACPKCGTAIRRIVVAQRGTHLCPTCQQEGDDV